MSTTVALDTNVMDWLLAPSHLAALLALKSQGSVKFIVTAEVAHEIHRMPDDHAAKRHALQHLLRQHLFPVRPTFVPIARLERSGLAYGATPRTEGFLGEMRKRGLRRLDAL